MLNRLRTGLLPAKGSWHRIKLSLKSWSHRTPTSRSLSCAVRWPKQRACGCTIAPSPTCCPGSGSRTKKSLVATERPRAKVRQQRANWLKHCIPAIAALLDRIVFIDETAVKTTLTRLRLGKTGPAPDDGCAVRKMGDPNPDCRPHTGCVDRAVGRKGGDGWPCFCRLRPRSADPGGCPRNRGHPRQTCHAPEQGSRSSYARTRLLVPLPAAILAGPGPHRASLLKAKRAPAADRRKNIHRSFRSYWGNLRSLRPGRV